MSGFNGSGTYVRFFNWVNDKTNGIDITASRFDTEDGGFATGLSTVICKDGQTTTSAVIPFAQGLSITGGTANAPGITFIGDSQTGFFNSTSGAAAFSSRGVQSLTLSAAGITLLGSASGQATIAVKATAGTNINFTLPITNGTNGQLLQTDGSGNASWVSVGSGSGTVNSGTSGQLAYYASSTNAVSGNASINVSGAALTVGVANTSLGQLKLTGSTSGTITITPPVTAGSGTLTLPVATDTLVGKATTDTLTNKTFDTAGTGNVFKISGTQISSISGNTSKVATTSGTLTSTHLAAFDSSGNIVDGGAAGGLITPLAVGSITFATLSSPSSYSAGATSAAASLTFYSMNTGTGGATQNSTDSFTGTWKALNSGGGSNTTGNLNLWQRIS